MIATSGKDLKLPSSPDAEQQVIGSLLLAPERIGDIAKLLKPSDFLDSLHRATYSVIIAMHRDQLPIDVATVKAELDRCKAFVETGTRGAVYLAETSQSVSTAARVRYHADIVAEASRKRRVHEVVRQTLDTLRSDQLGDSCRLAFLESEAASLCGVKSSVLRDARLRGEITSTRIGGRIGYEVEELRAYLHRNRVQVETFGPRRAS